MEKIEWLLEIWGKKTREIWKNTKKLTTVYEHGGGYMDWSWIDVKEYWQETSVFAHQIESRVRLAFPSPKMSHLRWIEWTTNAISGIILNHPDSQLLIA